MKEPIKHTDLLPLLWIIEFILILIIAFVACLIVTAIFGQTTFMELSRIVYRLINV